MQPFDRRSDLFANRRAQDGVCRIETLGLDYPARDIIGAEQLARCGPENAKAESRQFIPGEVPVASIGALWLERLRVEIGRQNAQRAVDMREVGAILVKLPLQLVDNPSEFAALLDQPGDNEIACRDHAMALCQ